MLKLVSAWIQAHPLTRLDERAAMACAHALGVNSSDETMFMACWNMAHDFARLSNINECGYTGAATEAVNEAAEKQVVTIVDSFISHMTVWAAARAELAALERAASSARHDLRIGYRYFQPIPVDTRAFERANYARRFA